MRSVRILLAAYLVVVSAVVWWPTPVDRPVAGSVRHVVSGVQDAGIPGFSYHLLEVATNVAMFVPLGFLLVLAIFRTRWWLAVAASAAVSTVFELVQLLLLSGRVASVADVAANTLGGAVGAILARTCLWLSRRAASRHNAPAAPPEAAAVRPPPPSP